ncbi:MAG TPA: hypothetical protein DDZ89_00900 [Clostridiales bacterium]|nr:hypothetical protein [Clostridiales bacterium]
MSHDLTVLYQYMMFKEARYYNDVVQLYNNVCYRKADPVDHLEMIMAQTRLATAQEIFNDIYKVIRMIKEG